MIDLFGAGKYFFMGDFSAKRVEFHPTHIGTLLLRRHWPPKKNHLLPQKTANLIHFFDTLRGIMPENNIFGFFL